MDIERIRKDFPILDSGIVYFDNAASSLTPEPVLEKMLEYYHQYRANIERGVHRLSQRASTEYEAAREKIGALINAAHSDEVIITRNTSEGINMVASGLTWAPGDRVVITLLEHHSNYIVWLRLREKYGVNIQYVRPNQDGLLNPENFEKAINDRTKIVALTQVSNVFGTIAPVKEVAALAHRHGAMILVDGAQSVPHMKVDVQDLACDFLAFSGHKMCGPTGASALYMRKGLEDMIEPLAIGGGTIKDVGLEYYTLSKSPERFEAGTPPVAEAIGLGRAADYLRQIGMDQIQQHEERLVTRMYEDLSAISNVTVYGPKPEHRTGIVSLNIGDLNPHDVALALDVSANIMVRSGHHCAYPVMKEVIHAPSGSVRASLYLYNTEREVDLFITTVREIASSLA
ncbi:cysteine desulfurase [Candidatus Bathyarchaeota archaeon]|nr:cysteine desulfurase [Candidatus Bathyarchaeota archaeon]